MGLLADNFGINNVVDLMRPLYGDVLVLYYSPHDKTASRDEQSQTELNKLATARDISQAREMERGSIYHNG